MASRGVSVARCPNPVAHLLGDPVMVSRDVADRVNRLFGKKCRRIKQVIVPMLVKLTTAR
jgi:hypothetical protein